MNWKLILRWAITFTVCIIIYDVTGSFWMSLGILILLAVVESLVISWWQRRKARQAIRELFTPEEKGGTA